MLRFKKIVQDNYMTKKKDLSILLQVALQKHKEDVAEAMSNFTYFDNFPEYLYEQCLKKADIVEYSANEVILGKKLDKEVTYFILEGSAIVIHKLFIKKIHLKGIKHPYYKLMESFQQGDSKVEVVLMQACRLLAGACFGLGEKLCEDSVVAETGVTCLLVPRCLLLESDQPDNTWRRVKAYLDGVYPTRDELFDTFVLKRALQRVELSRYRLPPSQSIHDTPLTTRTFTGLLPHYPTIKLHNKDTKNNKKRVATKLK